MNDYNSKLDGFSAPELIIRIERAAKMAWEAITSGRVEVTIAVNPPNNQTLYLTIHVIDRRESAGVSARERATASGYKLLFEFQHPPHPCPECRIHTTSGPVRLTSANNLAASIALAAKHVYDHGCLQSQQEESSDRKKNLDRGTPIRIHGPAARVKLRNAAESAPKRQPAIIKKTASLVKVMNPSSKQEAMKALPQAPSNTPVEGALNAPSICYTLPATALVEVTVPYYICHQLINECSKSNHHGREVGGVLIGHRYEQKPQQSGLKEYKTLITDILPIESADSSSAHIRLDEDAWINVMRELDVKYEQQNKVQLGWYHTHPTQGIFFSPYDVDAHTIFRQPFQFAFVVDPQTMEAGLFYWNNYGSKSLAGPIKFSLNCERENDAPPSRVGFTRNPISRFRALLLGFFGVVIAAFSWQELGNQNSMITPDQACLVSLISLVWLRLWNANVFHPVNPIETLVTSRVKRYLVRKFQDLINIIRNKHAGLKFSVVRALGMVAIGALITYGVVKYEREKPPPVSNSAEPSSNSNSRGGPIMITRRVLLLETHLPQAAKKVVLELNNTGVRVEYLIQGSKEIQVVDEVSEKNFFSAVFGLKIQSAFVISDDIRGFQQLLDLGDSADGRWGNNTRNAFIRMAMRYNLTKEPMRVPLSNDRFIDITFDRENLTDRSSSQ